MLECNTSTTQPPSGADKFRARFDEERKRIMSIYDQRVAKLAMKIILFGYKGSGKTSFLMTGRKPILIHSFDPGGTLHMWKKHSAMIEAGDLLIDSRFEEENLMQPKSWELWVREYERLEASKFFDGIGTYAIDTLTLMGDNVLNWCKDKDPKYDNDKVPDRRHYHRQVFYIAEMMKRLTSLPCDVVLTGHAREREDAEGNVRAVELAFTKSGTVKIPAIYEEMYVARTIKQPVSPEYPNGVKYVIQTQPDGLRDACTRWGDGKFKQLEEPNLKMLRGKAGLSMEDVR